MVKTRLVVPLVVVTIILLGPCRLGAQSAGEIEIPNKLGLGLSLYNQTQPYEIASLEVQLPGVDPATLQNLDVDNNTSSYHLRVDYWILPFLNIFGLFGQIDGSTEVDLQGIDIGLPIGINNLTIDYDGTVYGGGAVLAVGGAHWFGAVAYDYTETDLEIATSSVQASIVTPKVGYHFDGGAVWVGAMYQDAEETHEGTYTLPYLGPVPYRVELNEKESWNYLIGGTASLAEHWVLILQGGFGERDSALVTLEYRLF
jgi:hypothetical protein